MLQLRLSKLYNIIKVIERYKKILRQLFLYRSYLRHNRNENLLNCMIKVEYKFRFIFKYNLQ